MMMLAMVTVLLTTDLGQVELQLDKEHAPISTANFVKYVTGHFYDGGSFFRTVTKANQPLDKVKIAVIQGTSNPEKRDTDPPIHLERTNVTGIKHKDGTLSMARSGPDTATVDFFICVGDQPELDYGGKRNPDGQGFAAFGKVVRGMDIVRKIHESKAEGQKLTPPVKILKAEIR
jgi:peptidyl-prolyl cis-trans isomerase A (cyclophilin A)